MTPEELAGIRYRYSEGEADQEDTGWLLAEVDRLRAKLASVKSQREWIINALDAAGSDPREPERYRETYLEAASVVRETLS